MTINVSDLKPDQFDSWSSYESAVFAANKLKTLQEKYLNNGYTVNDEWNNYQGEVEAYLEVSDTELSMGLKVTTSNCTYRFEWLGSSNVGEVFCSEELITDILKELTLYKALKAVEEL